MKKVNIAIIDSGLNAEELDYKCRIEYVYTCEPDNYRDTIGHGTNVVQTILYHETRINIYIFKIFQNKLICDVKELIKALQIIYLEYPFINVVNMSLGIPNENLLLRCYCEELKKKGIKLVSAYNNNNEINAYPAAYSFVYGVKAAIYKNCYEYSLSDDCNITMYGYLPYSLIEKNHITCKTNSFAAAHFSGIISNEILESYKKEIVKNIEFDNYLKTLEDFKWIKSSVIIDEKLKVNTMSREKNNINLVGLCRLMNDIYEVIYEKDNSFYDTLIIDNYFFIHEKKVVLFIISNIKKGKNIFCLTGFGRETDSLLYSLSELYKCKLYIKYVC